MLEEVQFLPTFVPQFVEIFNLKESKLAKMVTLSMMMAAVLSVP